MIILLDGCNGSGKDYCIQKIVKFCIDYELTYKVMSIKDVYKNEKKDQ